jgi:voltage-gated potassium channel
MSATNKDLTRAQRRRGITLGLLRALGISAVLIALYYLAPLDLLTEVPLLLSLIIGLLALAAMTAYQVRAVLRAAHPGVRGIEALATTVPLFLLLFAATYFLMSHTSTSNFNVHALTRTDSIYFTVTVFATVGFGDIPGQPSGSPGRHGPDDPQPDRPRCRRQTHCRRGPARTQTTRTGEN